MVGESVWNTSDLEKVDDPLFQVDFFLHMCTESQTIRKESLAFVQLRVWLIDVDRPSENDDEFADVAWEAIVRRVDRTEMCDPVVLASSRLRTVRDALPELYRAVLGGEMGIQDWSVKVRFSAVLHGLERYGDEPTMESGTKWVTLSDRRGLRMKMLRSDPMGGILSILNRDCDASAVEALYQFLNMVFAPRRSSPPRSAKRITTTRRSLHVVAALSA